MSRIVPLSQSAKKVNLLNTPRVRDWLYSLYPFIAILLLAMAWGLFVRFDGLGTPPLVVDEYFSVTSVEYILEKGVPEFPTGGYYTRGLPLQYLQAGSVLLFGDNEFAHRLPAALFGVLTLALVFLYARKFLPLPLAAICVAMLSVSAWQIEFGRFSRMYAAFQCVTVAFFLVYRYAYFEGRERLRYLPHALALLAVVFHALGLFLLPFLFLPIFIDRNAAQGATPPRNRLTFAMVCIATTLAGVAYWRLDSSLRNFHVGQRLPDGFHVPPSDSLGPLHAYAVLPIGGKIVAILLMILFGAGLILFFRSRSNTPPRNRLTAVDVLLLLLLLSTLVHLFAVSICIAAVLFIRYQMHRDLLRNRARLILLLLSGLTICAWMFYAWYDQSWRSQLLATRFLRELRIVFFGWPDFYEPIFCPLMASLPLFTVMFLAAFAWHLVRQGRQSITSILGHPIIIVLGVFCSIAVIDPVFQPAMKTTRYVYNVYPFVILLIVMACYDVIRLSSKRIISPNNQVILSGLVVMGLFVAGEDFSLHQLLHVNSPEIMFRTGKFSRYAPHWFWRRDERSAAEFLNAHRNEVDRLVVSMHSNTSFFYLHRGLHFAVYCSREGMDAPLNSRAGEDAVWYGEVARSKGKVELWTGRPLLGTKQELRAYTEGIRSLYVLRQVAPHQQDFDVNQVWPDRLVSSKRVFLSSDGSTEVVKIVLKQGDQENAALNRQRSSRDALSPRLEETRHNALTQ